MLTSFHLSRVTPTLVLPFGAPATTTHVRLLRRRPPQSRATLALTATVSNTPPPAEEQPASVIISRICQVEVLAVLDGSAGVRPLLISKLSAPDLTPLPSRSIRRGRSERGWRRRTHFKTICFLYLIIQVERCDNRMSLGLPC